MTTTLFSFGNWNYYPTLDRLEESAQGKVDNIVIFKESDIDTDFYVKHQQHFRDKRGFGYWIWKSYLVFEILKLINNNDILVYADAGCTMNMFAIHRFNQYLNIVNSSQYGILSFELDVLEKTYTKMDLFEYLGLNTDKFLNSKQIIATTFILKKCNHTINLINEWYNTACIYNLIDDSPSILKNDDSFIEHRHDQSIFSLIAKKYGTEILPDETYHKNFNIEIILYYPILATRYV